jgi:uncharacterized protein (DUF488 family)
MPDKKLHIFTIGHSTKPIEEFIQVLTAYGIKEIVDVRTIPKSRHNPQFNSDILADSLRGAGIGYTHMKGLGGLRHTKKDSPNKGWRNSSFRGFADYMQTGEFEASLKELMEKAKHNKIAVMCAEALPWRCHRSLIADVLTIRSVEVTHIMSSKAQQEHVLTPFAKIEGNNIIYPEEG